jgi:DNA polymerase-3 subunit delta
LPQLTPAALRKQIAAETLDPLYMLIGDDDAEKSAVAGELADMVDEGLRAFNVDRLYGGDTKVDDVIQAAATLPMMAPRRLVIVLEAEKLLIPKRESRASEEALERLEEFLKDPPSHASVVFVCGHLDNRRRMVVLLRKQASVVDCGSIADGADAERWVKARAIKMNIPLDAGAAHALAERAGIDIVRLRAGLERVALYAMGQASISADDVRQSVPAAAEAPRNFGIANAIQQNDARTAIRELHAALEAADMPLQSAAIMITGQLRYAAEQLPASRLRGGIDAVFRTDLALKSSGGDPRVLLERLVVEMCEPKRR